MNIEHILFILAFLSRASQALPLIPDEPNAVPIQQLGFVYLPKQVVETLLPRHDPHDIRNKACEVASLFSLPCPPDMKTQVMLIQAYDRYRLQQIDPTMQKRRALRKQLCRLNTELQNVILTRQPILQDLQRAQKALAGCDAYQITDARKAECSTLQAQYAIQNSQFQQMNSREEALITEIDSIKRKLKLFML
jgi:chaperonin cofactor prefoldin